MTHPYAFALSDNVQGLRTGPPSFVTSAFFDLPLPCPNSLPVAAGWVEGRRRRPEPEAQCYVPSSTPAIVVGTPPPRVSLRSSELQKWVDVPSVRGAQGADVFGT